MLRRSVGAAFCLSLALFGTGLGFDAALLPASPTVREVAPDTPVRQSRLVGLPVYDASRKMIGTVDNVVLGRRDGDFIVIAMDRGILPGTRLIGIYRNRVVEISTPEGPALRLRSHHHDDLKAFETFVYTPDMQLAEPRSSADS